ncbi:MAG: Transcription initiation factor IIA subunit [Paramarteilia canceri]
MYEIYRATTLGAALQCALEELVHERKLKNTHSEKILKILDNEMNAALTTKSKTKMNFNGRIKSYRYCDFVWTFVLSSVNFSEMQNHLGCDRLKIVSCEHRKG